MIHTFTGILIKGDDRILTQKNENPVITLMFQAFHLIRLPVYHIHTIKLKQKYLFNKNKLYLKQKHN